MIGLPDNTVQRLMTVKEVSEALSIHPDTVNSWVKKLFPDLPKNGIATKLDEFQVTRIKQSVETSGRSDLRNVTQLQNVQSELQITEMTLTVLSYLKSETDRLRAELTSAQPALESHAALMRSENTMSITDAAKHFGLHPKAEVFPYLRERGYLTEKDLPTQAALDAGYLSLRETKCPDGTVRAQSVVEVRQLETWRLRVVPQIQRWKAEEIA